LHRNCHPAWSNRIAGSPSYEDSGRFRKSIDLREVSKN
jgi:hypothetical protein